jgi:2-polyprenyl-3-methyl-5-hydroxy-6-metoxy-1,4-benzoquinol methylase
MGESRQFYEDLWRKGWLQELEAPGVSHQTRRRLFLSCFRKVYHPGASVLDAGCGDGTLLRDVVREFPDVGPICGTDVSETALQAARQRLPNGRFLQADLQTQPPPFDQPFDIVTSCEVLEHVQDYRGFLKHLTQSLRNGGALVLSVPHDMRNWGPHDEAVGHLRRFDAEGLKRDLEEAGFVVERIVRWGCVLYQLYYTMVLNRVKPETTWSKKGAVSRLLHRALYWCFHLDDLFTWTGRGRMLFVVARRP